MIKRKGFKALKIFMSVVFIISILPNPGKALNTGSSTTRFPQDDLAVQSIFDPISAEDSYKIKDLALVESMVFGHIQMDDTFLSRSEIVEETISEQTSIRYDIYNLQKVSKGERVAGYLLPVYLQYTDIKTKQTFPHREYFVYITPENRRITSFTKEEKQRIERNGFDFLHAERKEADRIRAIIEHELWTDMPLMQLAPKDLIALGELDKNVKVVNAFLRAMGAVGLAGDFFEFVKEGRVYKVNPEAEVSIPGHGKVKVSNDRVKVDHASNIGIYVKDRAKKDQIQFQFTLIHEILAKAGVFSSVNNDMHIKELLLEAFKAYLTDKTAFEKKKKQYLYAFYRAFEDDKTDKTFEELTFNNVDLNVLRDRDLSFPSDRKERLSNAKKAINAWKIKFGSKAHWDKHPFDTPAVSFLQREALATYNKYKLYELSVGEILEYVYTVFDGNNYSLVKNEIEHIVANLSDFDLLSKPHELTPNNFHEVARDLGFLKFEGSFSEVNNVNFVFHRLVFDFFRTERRIAELAWMAKEIQRERDFPGAARLPMICAIQDLHGAAPRAMALVGYAAGLKPNILEDLLTVKDPGKYLEKLKEMLKDAGINIKLQDIRYVGMNDIYDRGENPVGAFELTKWLGEQQKLKFVIGNHDEWRAMGVLGVDRYFKEIAPNIDLQKEPHKGHSAPFWAQEAWIHAGWGPTEIDQVNEEKVNRQIRGINDQLRRFNDVRKRSGIVASAIPLLGKVNLRPEREAFAQNVKTMKLYNHRLRQKEQIDEGLKNKLDLLKNSGVLNPEQISQMENNEELKLPDTLQVTMKVLKNKISELNNEIERINDAYQLGLWPIKVHLADYSNYYKDPDVIKRTLWQMKRFRLFYVDIFGFVHLHSVIPFNKDTKKIDVEYMGQTGFEALELMQSKVQIFFEELNTIPDTPEWRTHMMEEIGDILIMVNSWYSDKTKTAKPKKVSEFVNAGGMIQFTDITKFSSDVSYFSDRRPTMGLVFGHNERKKFDPNDFTDTPLPWMFPYPESETFQVLIDWQMSEGYKEEGGMFTVFKRDESGQITGLKSYGYKEPKGRVIEDITTENLEVLSREQKDFLLKLSKNDKYSQQQKDLLRKLSKEEVDNFEDEFSGADSFMKKLAEDENIYNMLESSEAKDRLKGFMEVLSEGKRFGLSDEQKKMIQKMSDGEWFMRWFQVKALKQVYEYADQLVEKAEEKGRKGKKAKLEDRRDSAANALERFGILIRPDVRNALNVIAELESEENAVFSEDEFFDLRVEEEKSEKYRDVIPESDRIRTKENIKEEVKQLLKSGFIEETEGGYKATDLVAGMDKPRINALIDRVPELKNGTVSSEITDSLKTEVARVKLDIIHEQKLGQDMLDQLISGEEETKIVYHLLPEKLIPFEQRWIIQEIKIAERDHSMKERIRFLNDEEYENLNYEVSLLIDKGFLVDVALLNPTEDDVAGLVSGALKGKVKALVFEQEELGNFQQIEGIICALRALYHIDRTEMINSLNEISKLLSGTELEAEIKEALMTVNVNDPLEMYEKGIKLSLPPIEIKDWQKLKDLNKIMQRVLMQA